MVVEFREGKYSDEDYSRLCKDLAALISKSNGLTPKEILVIAPKTIPKTTSGKISRSRCRDEYLHSKLRVLHKETFSEAVQPLEIEKAKVDSATASVDILPTINESVGLSENDDGVNLPSQLDKKDTVGWRESVAWVVCVAWRGIGELFAGRHLLSMRNYVVYRYNILRNR